MATVKTAISVEEKLFREVDRLARRTGISRSRLFCLGVEALLRSQEQKDLARKLKEFYAGHELDEEDRRFLDFAAAEMAHLTKDDQW
jgi:metal-responsive CopG/Arc/MetJ family transcriptional regulator